MLAITIRYVFRGFSVVSDHAGQVCLIHANEKSTTSRATPHIRREMLVFLSLSLSGHFFGYIAY